MGPNAHIARSTALSSDPGAGLGSRAPSSRARRQRNAQPKSRPFAPSLPRGQSFEAQCCTAAQGPDERAWSASTSLHPRASRQELVGYTALPAETGPIWAPDRLSLWPVEGGRYGIDAHYHGATGMERAVGQKQRLRGAGLTATVRKDETGGLIRVGPLTHGAVWVALEAFLGRPIPDVLTSR